MTPGKIVSTASLIEALVYTYVLPSFLETAAATSFTGKSQPLQ